MDLTVQPLRRCGRDFLYVTDAVGATLGYFDRNSGRLHVTDPAMRSAVLEALTPQLAEKFAALGSRPDAGSVPARPDLAAGAAGTVVAEQAARRSEVWTAG